MKPAQIQKDANCSEGLAPPKARVEKSPCGKFEYIHPKVKLASKVSVICPRGKDPTTAANHHVSNLAYEFSGWVADMRLDLNSAWQTYLQDPLGASNKTNLIAAVHVIKGNAPAIGYKNAGDLAGSLAKFLEHDSDWANFEKPLGLCISAILATLSERGKLDSPQNLDMLNAIAVLIERKIRSARQTKRGTLPSK